MDDTLRNSQGEEISEVKNQEGGAEAISDIVKKYWSIYMELPPPN
jgi:hypothetical protein